MAKPSYGGLFKDVRNNLTKRFDDWSHETVRNADSINISKTDREDSNKCSGQTSPGINHTSYENKIGEMIECSHQGEGCYGVRRCIDDGR